MNDVRDKVKIMITKALDDRTPEEERVSTAFKALTLIEKHSLLESPLSKILKTTDNETVGAAVSILDRLIDPGLGRDIRKVRDGFRRRK